MTPGAGLGTPLAAGEGLAELFVAGESGQCWLVVFRRLGQPWPVVHGGPAQVARVAIVRLMPVRKCGQSRIAAGGGQAAPS